MRALGFALLLLSCGGSSTDAQGEPEAPLGTTTNDGAAPATTSAGSAADTDTSGTTTDASPKDEGGETPDPTFSIEPCDDWMCAVYDAADDDADRSCAIAPATEWSATVEYGLIGQHHPGPLPTGFAHYLTPAARQRTAIVDLNDCHIAA